MKKKLLISALFFSNLSHAEVAVPYYNFFQQSAKKHNVSVPALLAIAELSSGFKPNIDTHQRCGLMQVSVHNKALWSGELDCFDPKTNIDLGAQAFSLTQQDTQGSIELALKHYMRGYYPDSEKAPLTKKEKQWDRDIIILYKSYQKLLK